MKHFTINSNKMNDGTSRSLVLNDVLTCNRVDRSHWMSTIRNNPGIYLIYLSDATICGEITAIDTKGNIVVDFYNPTAPFLQIPSDHIKELFKVEKITREVSKAA